MGKFHVDLGRVRKKKPTRNLFAFCKMIPSTPSFLIITHLWQSSGLEIFTPACKTDISMIVFKISRQSLVRHRRNLYTLLDYKGGDGINIRMNFFSQFLFPNYLPLIFEIIDLARMRRNCKHWVYKLHFLQIRNLFFIGIIEISDKFEATILSLININLICFHHKEIKWILNFNLNF